MVNWWTIERQQECFMILKLLYSPRSTYSSLQTVEVVNYDSNKQVEHKESTHNDENNEVNVSTEVTLVCRLFIYLKGTQKTGRAVELSCKHFAQTVPENSKQINSTLKTYVGEALENRRGRKMLNSPIFSITEFTSSMCKVQQN